jgi:NADH dehydrogenase FAD-containing subunit
MMAALRLSGKTRKFDTEITLINGIDTFIERPRLPEVATGQNVPQTPIREMLRGTRVKFLKGWATGLDLDSHSVTVQTLQGDQSIPYDILVYALGSVVDQDTVPGVRENAYVLDPRGSNATTALREKLRTLTGRVVVVGGGATGIEGSTEIRGWFPHLQVSLVTDARFGSFKGPRVERHFREGFAKQGIQIHEGSRVRSVEPGRLILANGKVVPFDLALWASGFRATPLARESGFNVSDRGQILVDPYGRSLSHPDIYAIGDASLPVEEPGNPFRMSLLTAITGGTHAADNITALLRGREPSPLSFAHYGQAISMGPNDAVGFLGYPDDKQRGPIYRGKTAVVLRNFFVAMLFNVLKLERQFPGFYYIVGKSRYAKSKRAQKRREASESPLS